jgi:hypothetical protein
MKRDAEVRFVKTSTKNPRLRASCVARRLGLEPRLEDSESSVLPLDDLRIDRLCAKDMPKTGGSQPRRRPGLSRAIPFYDLSLEGFEDVCHHIC